MASTYVNNLRLEEIGTGEQSGTWGDTTNTNLKLIGQAVAWGERAITNSSNDDNITIGDGALDADRCLGLKLTGGGTACTVNLLPPTSSKTWIMYNSTAAALTFSCGSGASVIIPAGHTKVIATDGLGSGGVVHDLLTAVNLAGTTTVDDLAVTDDLVVGDDLGVTGLVTIGETLGVTGVLTTTAATVFNGGFASNADSLVGTDKKIKFRDAAIYINSSTDGQLDIVADTEIQIAATTIDINGAINASGEIIAASLDISGDADIDGTLETDGLTVGGVAAKVAGLETIWVPAAAMYPSTTNPCSDLTQVETTALRPDMKVLDFAAAADDFAQFSIGFPKSWNEGVIKFQVFWTPSTTNTGDCIWGLQGVSVADGATIDVAFGTAVTVTDAGIGTVEDQQVSPLSGEVTLTNAAVDTQSYFQIFRDANAGGDTFTGVSRLLGIKLFFTTDAANDA